MNRNRSPVEVSSLKKNVHYAMLFCNNFHVFFSWYFFSRLPISDSKRSSMSGLMTSLSTIKRILCAWAKWEFGQHYPVELLGRRRRGLASVSVGLWSFYHRDEILIFSQRWWKLKNSDSKVDLLCILRGLENIRNLLFNYAKFLLFVMKWKYGTV